MPWINNPVNNYIYDKYRKINHFFYPLLSWLNRFYISSKIAPALYIILGLIFLGVPNGVTSAQAFPQLYGLHYIVLLTCVILNGPVLSAVLYLALVLIRLLFLGYSFTDIFGAGIPLEDIVNNFVNIPNNIIGNFFSLLITISFIILFWVATNILQKKLRNREIKLISFSHIIAIVFCSLGLTIFRTQIINFDIFRLFTFSSILLLAVETIGILALYTLLKQNRIKGIVLFGVGVIAIYMLISAGLKVL